MFEEAEGLVAQATVLVHQGDRAAAVPLLERATRLRLGMLSAWYALATALCELRRPEEALAELQRWAGRVAEREAVRARARRKQYLKRHGTVPCWVERGMASGLERREQVGHRVQMLLGIFSAHAVLPPEYKPAQSIGELLVQHLDDLEQEVADRGGLDMVVAQHFAKVYRVCATPTHGLGALTQAA
jgi:hypothetical protein